MSVEVTELRVPANNGIPNNGPLPALIYAAALTGDENAAYSTMRDAGWGGCWTWTVFDYHHYHPASHEALICVMGWARIHLGGPDGPIVDVSAGDAMILPAGFGHKRVASGDGFAVVGGYPRGQEAPAILRADGPVSDRVLAQIAATPLPETDPIFGADGPLIEAWSIH